MRGSRLLRLLVSVSFAASAGVSVQALTAAPAAAATAAVPRPDHVVIVVEENRGFGTVLGSPNAPFINSLAAAGADFTQSFAETHPSQPNYLALFSGSTQGLTDDSCPHTYTAGDLGSQLIAAGLGFAGYSESLPSVGYTGCGSGKYARKHAPWVNFSNLAASTNQPFTAFPTDYSLLPEVSFVIPNLDNDMHDGTVAQGDQWLQNNLGGYITWAQTHNSVFVLTFDEDEGTSPNQIPTIITGQGVVPGSYAETINHYNLLRTLEDAYGLAPLGAAASAAPIVDIWAPPSGNQPPVAAFTSSCDQLGCSFDGSGSADPDGSISSYAWDFGDGATGSGVAPTHSYAAGGTNQVTLTVTDGGGATGAVTHAVTVSAPAGSAVAADGFGRSVSGGWGTADVGGVWSRVGSSSLFSVGAGVGQIRVPSAGSGPTVLLGSVSAADVDLLVDVGVDKVATGSGDTVVLMARRSGSSDYRLKLRLLSGGVVHLAWSRVVAGAERTLGEVLVKGLTYSPGQLLRVRFDVSGAGAGVTAVSGSVWPVGSVEPVAPVISGTDSEPSLQGAGSIGILAGLASTVTNAPVSFSFDNLAVTDRSAGV